MQYFLKAVLKRNKRSAFTPAIVRNLCKLAVPRQFFWLGNQTPYRAFPEKSSDIIRYDYSSQRRDRAGFSPASLLTHTATVIHSIVLQILFYHLPYSASRIFGNMTGPLNLLCQQNFHNFITYFFSHVIYYRRIRRIRTWTFLTEKTTQKRQRIS